MNERVNEFKQLVESRIRNIFIGSFFISWFFYHSRELLIFAFSTSEEKIKILTEYQLNIHHDFINPLLISLFFVIAVPVFTSVLKLLVTNHTYAFEEWVEKIKILKSHSNLSVIALSEAKTTSSYATRITEEKIDEWIDERKVTLSELEKLRTINKNITNQISELKSSNLELSYQINYYKGLYERSISSLKGVRYMLANLHCTCPIAGDIKRTHGSDSLEYSEYIRKMTFEAIQSAIDTNNAQPFFRLEGYEWIPPFDTQSDVTKK